VRPDRNDLGRNRWPGGRPRPGAADDEGPGAATRTKPAITKLRSGVPDR